MSATHAAPRNGTTAFLTGTIFGALGIMLGAFGAHGLKDTLIARNSLGLWQTATDYLFIHALALLILGTWTRAGGAGSRVAWLAWSGGVVLFSGSLYALALGAPRGLGPVTPLGGTAFIAGWIALGVAVWRNR